MKSVFLIISLITLVTYSFGQEISLPPVSVLKTQKDLERTKSDLIRAANWLEKTPLDQHAEKRKEVEKFVFMWVSASKTINVDMNQKILSLDEINPGIVMIYTAATAKFLIQTNPTQRANSQLAGLKTILKVYKSGKGIQKDPRLDDLNKANRRGKMKEWLHS